MTAEPLPATLHSPMGTDEVLAALQTLSRKGKLPGFAPAPGGFRCTAFGDPFDYVLQATLQGDGAGSKIDFSLTIAPKLPAIALLLTLVTIQPGMWLTDSMLVTYSTWYAEHVRTWWWYVPLVILPTPLYVWRMWKRSRASANDHARELLERLAMALRAGTEGPSA